MMPETDSLIYNPQVELEIKKENNLNKFLIVIALFVIGISFFIFQYNQKSSGLNESSSKVMEKKVSPTPFPFQEMTIPYLKSRIYKSYLEEMTINSQNESYTSYLTSYESDGLKTYGQLTVPVGEKPKEGWPAIIFVHGYIPPKNYETFANYVSYVDFLARQGFVVFKIDLRGHGNSEGEPGGGYYSGDYMQNSDFVNPNKIGLWGHSMAGNVVSRVMAVRPEIPAVVIWAGAVYTYIDFLEYRIDDNSYQPPSADSQRNKKRDEMFNMYGRFDPKSSFWKQVPMTNYLDEIKGAISLNHAVDDTVVDIRYSRNLNNLLDKTSIPHELNEYPSGGHNFTGASFSSAMQKTVEFFMKYLN